MGDPGAFGGRAALHQLQQAERQRGNEQRLESNADEDGHQLAPFALRARAIISSSWSSSFSLSLSDIPRRALAALAGEPLKNTRTISLNADFFATVSDSTGLKRNPRSDSLRWTKPLSSSRLSIARTAEPLSGSGRASQMSTTASGPRS